MQINEEYEDSARTVEIKAELLSFGVDISKELINNFGPPFLEKRRAYGNQDPVELREFTIPQELYLDNKNIIVSINIRRDSPWVLTFEAGEFFLIHKEGKRYKTTFPLRPSFYNTLLSDGSRVNQIITLYGGRSLGIFVYGTCSLVLIGKPCHYCSIEPNRSKATDFEKVVKNWQLKEALTSAISMCSPEINQIMINGGNFPDLDKSFLYYVELVKTAEKVLKDLNKSIEIHLIVFPPKNLYLIEHLKETNAKVSMNTEIFDLNLFNTYCPGKESEIGQKHIFNAHKEAVKHLGEGRVYSILVGGLEPLNSLNEGLKFLANQGVIPVINVFHPDPETPLQNRPTPTPREILSMGKALQNVYEENDFMKPFYFKCGRNSLDTEAYLKMFR